VLPRAFSLQLTALSFRSLSSETSSQIAKKSRRKSEEMSKLGVGRYLRRLGVMEIAFAALFVVAATMKLGFILVSCYFAGAIATELSHETLKVNPFIPIALLWIGVFIRDRSIFF